MIEDIELVRITDNPFQPRRGYSPKTIDELAASIAANGLLHTPMGRRCGPGVELALGHYRLRAYRKLAEADPAKWGRMPVDVRELTDQDMVAIAVEENMKRRDITPIETARSVVLYFKAFPNETETALAARLGLSQGHVANMKRVMALPQYVLDKIDEGKVTFTAARELCSLSGLTGAVSAEYGQKGKALTAEELIVEACKSFVSDHYGGSSDGNGEVAKMKRAIGNELCECYPSVDPEDAKMLGYGRADRPAFKVAPCAKCKKSVVAEGSYRGKRRVCTDRTCWQAKQTEATAAAEANARRLARESAARIVGAAPVKDMDVIEQVDRRDVERKREEAKKPTARMVAAANPEVAIIDGDIAPFPSDEEVLRAKLGSRAELIDLATVSWRSGYNEGMQTGWNKLTRGALQELADPEGCLMRCTKGFHVAYTVCGETCFVCSISGCFGKKKGALTRERNCYANELKKRINTTVEASGKLPEVVALFLRLTMLQKLWLAAGDFHINSRLRGTNGNETEEHRMFSAIVPDLDALLASQKGEDGTPEVCEAIRQAVYAAPIEKVAGALLRDLLWELFTCSRTGTPDWSVVAKRAIKVLAGAGIDVDLSGMPHYREHALSEELLAVLEGAKPLPTDGLEASGGTEGDDYPPPDDGPDDGLVAEEEAAIDEMEAVTA